MVQKVVNIKAKISLKSSIIIWNLDIHYLRVNAYFTIFFQKSRSKDLIPKHLNSRSLGPKTQNLLIKNLLFYSALIS